VAEIEMETQSLHHNHPGTQVIAAYVREYERKGSTVYHFSIICDEEAEAPAGSAMSSRLSKQYASYDEAVLGMNRDLGALMFMLFDVALEPCEVRGCGGYQHAE
jgi:hypothetical protein